MCFPFICVTHTASYMCSRIGETHFSRDICSGEHMSRRNIYHFDVTVICVSPMQLKETRKDAKHLSKQKQQLRAMENIEVSTKEVI